MVLVCDPLAACNARHNSVDNLCPGEWPAEYIDGLIVQCNASIKSRDPTPTPV